jgi:murein hydrolase activator
MSYRYRLRLIAGLLLVLATTTAIAGDPETTSAELEAVRERISALEREIDAARNESETLRKQLRSTEDEINAANRKLTGLQSSLTEKSDHLESLTAEQTRQRTILQDATEALARQIRAAYISGRRDYIKLLLNQEDPGTIGRTLTYYDYYNRARTEQISKVSGQLEELAQLARTIGKEQAELQQLQATEQVRLSELEGLRAARRQIMAHLDGQIRSHGEELGSLREDQQRLENLLEELRAAPTSPTAPLPPFGELRGKLDWPVSGRVLNRFGSSRRDGAMTWQGVRLEAREGEDVRAISSGQVIFADWFRNLGLLLIVDHGEGYMSLYGHNHDLLKTTGDWVEDGEIIAHAGSSGGQNQPAVYFEIRHQGKPVNPALWCRRP